MLVAANKPKQLEIEAQFLTARWPLEGQTFFFGEALIIDRNDEKKSRRIRIVGNAEQDELTPQLTYKWLGKWDNHHQYGNQFKVETFHLSRPYGKLGVIKYLQECPNIGPVAAETLWNAYQGDAVRVLRESPEQVKPLLKRVTLEQLQAASEKLNDLAAMEGISIELTDLLHGHGFPVRVAKSAVKVWGNKAHDIIARDPYKLQRFRGCGFIKCDKLYLGLGLPPTKLRRQTLCAQYSLAADRNGHTWFPIEVMASAVKAHFGSQPAGRAEQLADAKHRAIEPLRALELGIRARRFVTRRDCKECWGKGETLIPDIFDGSVMELATCPSCGGTGGKQWVAEAVKAAAELDIAEMVVTKLTIPKMWPTIGEVKDCAPDLTDHQTEHLARALSSPLAILGGSPGTGKTFTLAALVKAIIAKWGENSVAVCAPTGKAAVRCTETLAKYKIRGIRATTIHTLLGVDMAGSSGGGNKDDSDRESDGWSFKHNRRNPLPFRFVICDECSMLSSNLMRSFLAGCYGSANVLLVGDVNQLPPVESGAPLRDLRKVLPFGELTEIHRNAGTAVRACAAIRDGLPIPIDVQIDLTEGQPPKNLVLHGATRDEASRVIVNLVKKVAAEKKYDPIWGVQVCVATNKSGPLSRRELNKQLQAILNPHGQGHAQSPFRVGDKVICVKNTRLPLARYEFGEYRKEDGGLQTLICNGEFGKVFDAQPTKTVVMFGGGNDSSPGRVVIITRKAGVKPDKDGGAVPDKRKGDDENESPAEEKTDTGCDLDLGYAVTTHKMQGSSAPYVIIALDENQAGDHGVCDRGWIFTAISRMETECHLVGRRDTVKKMAARNFIDKRQTFLAETIERLMKSAGVVIPEPESTTSGECEATETDDEAGDWNDDELADEPTDVETPPLPLVSAPADDDDSDDEPEPTPPPRAPEPRRKTSFATTAVAMPPVRRRKYTVHQAMELVDEIESLADDMPSEAQDFTESVLEKASSIAETIEAKNWVTEAQYKAIENMLSGMHRWLDGRDVTDW